VSPGRQFGTALLSVGGSAGAPSVLSSVNEKATQSPFRGRTAAREDISREQRAQDAIWERAPTYPQAVSRHRFKFEQMFPSGDVVAEWVATLALAFNDLSLVRVQMGNDMESKHRFLYWLRLGIAHFAEAASYLRATSKIPEIAKFIESLPEDVREQHRKVLECYDRHEKVIERIRNEAGFHYPKLKIKKGQRRKRTIQAVLEALGANSGEIVGEMIGDARFLFADDIASALVGRALTGRLTPSDREDLEVLRQVSTEIEEGIGAFVQFVSGVLARYIRLAIDQGAEWTPVPDPPS
jgi:hypothetical protein